MKLMKRTKLVWGFTLLEIVVVISLIVLLSTLTIVQLLRTRISSNEAVAISHARIISNSLLSYYTVNTPHTYPANLSDLALPVSNPPYIDPVLANGSKQGYEFNYSLADAHHFDLNINPESPGISGVRYFYVDETGVIRYNSSSQAGENDPGVQ